MYKAGDIIQTNCNSEKSIYNFWNKKLIIISNDKFNEISNCFNCVEIIDRKWKNPKHVNIKDVHGRNKSIICERIYTVPLYVISKKIGEIAPSVFKKIKTKLLYLMQEENQYKRGMMQGDIFMLKNTENEKALPNIQILANRPLLCLANSEGAVIAVPLSTKIDKTKYVHVLLTENVKRPSVALCEQIQSLPYKAVCLNNYHVFSNISQYIEEIKETFLFKQLAEYKSP